MTASASSTARTRSPAPLRDCQRQLLALVDAIGGTTSDLELQHLLLLYCLEPGSGAPYEAVPSPGGPRSFTAGADRQRLIERGLLAGDAQRWEITPAGRSAIGQARDLLLSAFARRIAGLRGDALLAETYRRSPYHAIRSELAARVLGDDPAALARIAAARPAAAGPALSTIGYEGRSLERYLNDLLGGGVTLLCDVRWNPISRKYGFSKATLADGCTCVGVRYEHLPRLGVPSEQRQHIETQAQRDALFADYERAIGPGQAPLLEQIAGWVRAGERVALTCYELLPEQCHRGRLARMLQQRFGAQFAPRHL
ncbi:MAG TPA: DUF488 domain-containing protein [Kofleriaceae bacterium]|nr:DUF488 domain-containing protein [Kofleriaceae bacterium]